MNIGKAAKITGLKAETIRYYEQIGLLTPAKRSDNGYRSYTSSDVEQLNFLQRSRASGFSIEECRQLLGLLNNPGRQSRHVKILVLEKAQRITRQIDELKLLQQHLLELASHCQANEAPNCAILEKLSEHSEGGAS